MSPNGRVEPAWARNGRERCHLEDNQLVAVRVTASYRLDFSPPTRLLACNYLRSSQPLSYDVAPAGRFLMVKPIAGSTDSAPAADRRRDQLAGGVEASHACELTEARLRRPAEAGHYVRFIRLLRCAPWWHVLTDSAR